MRAVDRAQAIKDMTSSEWQRGGGKLDKVKGAQKLTVDREPEFIYDRHGEIVGVDAWVRLFGPNGKEVRIDPHRRIVNPPTVPRSGIIETGSRDDKRRSVTPNPAEAFYEAVWDSVTSTPNPKGWRTRGTVTIVYSDTADGYIESFSDGSYSTARSGGSLSVNTSAATIAVWQGRYNLSQYSIRESFVSFDTTSIGDDDIVSDVSLSLWLTDLVVSSSFTVEVRQDDWAPTLTTADWVAGASLGGHTLLASSPSSGLVLANYNVFSSESAFLDATNLKTGTVQLLLNSSRHRLGNAPVNNNDEEIAQFSSADQSGTTQDPKLTITHEDPFTPSSPIVMSRPNRIWRLH